MFALFLILRVDGYHSSFEYHRVHLVFSVVAPVLRYVTRIVGQIPRVVVARINPRMLLRWWVVYVLWMAIFLF